MSRRVLHLLSQRASLTGSGVTLDALVSHAAQTGWEQLVSVGVPSDDRHPTVGGLDSHAVRPLRFGVDGELPFPVPGMSDVMPYPSTVFSEMTASQIQAYRAGWRRHIAGLVAEFRPHVIHSHHVWIMSSILKEIAPRIPVVTQCHATGLRQMVFCPQLADEVRAGCARNERFAVLHSGHARALESTLGIAGERIAVVGAGYREDLFHSRNRTRDESEGRANRLLYIGKYSAAKGLPWLLDAFERLRVTHSGLELHVAGSGAGEAADALRERMTHLAPSVVLHGQIDQMALASLMRRCSVCVLPSFYEGVPLVLVEAFACGCRLVATDLPGVRSEIAPAVGDLLEGVPLPRLVSLDVPLEEDLPRFVEELGAAIERMLAGPPLDDPLITLPGALDRFTWGAVFGRVEAIWELLPSMVARLRRR